MATYNFSLPQNDGRQYITLKTSGKYCDRDIRVTSSPYIARESINSGFEIKGVGANGSSEYTFTYDLDGLHDGSGGWYYYHALLTITVRTTMTGEPTVTRYVSLGPISVLSDYDMFENGSTQNAQIPTSVIYLNSYVNSRTTRPVTIYGSVSCWTETGTEKRELYLVFKRSDTNTDATLFKDITLTLFPTSF